MSLPHQHLTRQQAEIRIREVFPLVRQYLGDLLSEYRGQHEALHSALQSLLAHGRQSPQEFSLPLLVHAAISGAPEPAVPVAGVHALWWRSANVLDDFVDGAAGRPPLYGVGRGVAMMAALEGGYALPLRALEVAQWPPPLRRRLAADFLDGWTRATDGQIGDILSRPREAGTDEVLDVYRKKSGSVYGMACTMAARLAHAAGDGAEGAAGARDARERERSVAAWGEFGQIMGLLAQFRNDHDDLCDGPGEDLRNGTATYLLVHLLRTAPAAVRDRALTLLEQAATAESRRRELADLMCAADIVRPYNQLLTELSGRAHALLEELAPASPFAGCLRARVDAETRLLEPVDRIAGHAEAPYMAAGI
ncbi:polyprenyl synthetase family protein [Streptomyces oryzae]|uniref:Polyprenyl synthetase family protein n=1 Tax=Streptomyces oryzae TaxID=1434886 RepID=A0ABS3XJR4_9ACTN|nr:polyprenyl synthetase family protein [Streptomyces oryzae]